MKAMYIEESGQVEFINVKKLVRKKDEVLLKLLYGGVCGNDLGSYKGTFAYFNCPRIPGHEFSAEIVEADEDNGQGLRPEMIVTCNPHFNCGHCYSYKNEIVNAYMDNQTVGCQRGGAFQEYITMPSERIYDGKGTGPMLLAVIEPFCISYHGVSRAKVGTREKVLVTGVGTIRVLTAVATKAKGALVYISDVSEGKLGMAETFDVDGTILNDSPENFEKAVSDIIEGNEFGTTIEAVGLLSTFQNCIDAACFDSKAVVIGVGKESLDFNFTLLQKKEFSVFGSGNTLKKDFVELIDLVKNGETPIENIITNVCRFGSGAKVFYGFAHNPGDILKVIIDFTGN